MKDILNNVHTSYNLLNFMHSVNNTFHNTIPFRIPFQVVYARANLLAIFIMMMSSFFFWYKLKQAEMLVRYLRVAQLGVCDTVG